MQNINAIRLDSAVVGLLPRVNTPAEMTERFLRQFRFNVAELNRRSAQVDGMRADAATSIIAARDLEQVMGEVLRDEYAPRMSSDVMPISTGGVRPWVDSYIQKRATRTGIFDYVTDANMPWADVQFVEISRRLHMFGGKFGYSWTEMMQSREAGAALDREKMSSAREAAEDTRDLILMSGDLTLPSGGGNIRTGFLNDATVPITPVVGGVWSGKTYVQIINDISSYIAIYRVNTRRKENPERLLLSEAKFAQIEATMVGDSGKSILKWCLENFQGLKAIDALPALSTAGVGSVERAILYAKTERVVRGVVPLPFNFVATDLEGLRTAVYGVERIVGCEIRRPWAMLYIDGL